MKILEVNIQDSEVSQKLLELSISAISHSREFVFQDRSPSFAKIWNLLQFEPYKYMAVEASGQFCAVSGMVKTDFGPFLSRHQVFMDTDLFADSSLLGLKTAAQLIEARFKDSLISVYDKGFLWGIEHTPGGLQICQKFAKKMDVEFYFPKNTCLTHIPLQEFNPDSIKNNISFMLIQKCEKDQLFNFFSQYQASFNLEQPTLPRLSHGILSQLKSSTSQSFLVHSKTCGGILSDFSEARRYYTSGRNNIMLEKIRRSENWSDLKHKEIKILSLGMTWGNFSASDVWEILSFAKKNKYHFLATRDQPEFRQFQSALNFERRLFFGHRKDLANVKDWCQTSPFQIECFIA